MPIQLEWRLLTQSGRPLLILKHMKKSQASALIDHLVQANRSLADAVLVAETIDDEHERESLRKTLAETIANVAAYAIAPTLELYPELEPYPGGD